MHKVPWAYLIDFVETIACCYRVHCSGKIHLNWIFVQVMWCNALIKAVAPPSLFPKECYTMKLLKYSKIPSCTFTTVIFYLFFCPVFLIMLLVGEEGIHTQDIRYCTPGNSHHIFFPHLALQVASDQGNVCTWEQILDCLFLDVLVLWMNTYWVTQPSVIINIVTWN